MTNNLIKKYRLLLDQVQKEVSSIKLAIRETKAAVIWDIPLTLPDEQRLSYINENVKLQQRIRLHYERLAVQSTICDVYGQFLGDLKDG